MSSRPGEITQEHQQPEEAALLQLIAGLFVCYTKNLLCLKIPFYLLMGFSDTAYHIPEVSDPVLTDPGFTTRVPEEFAAGTMKKKKTLCVTNNAHICFFYLFFSATRNLKKRGSEAVTEGPNKRFLQESGTQPLKRVDYHVFVHFIEHQRLQKYRAYLDTLSFENFKSVVTKDVIQAITETKPPKLQPLRRE